MPLNPKRTVAELKELRTLTSDENGAQTPGCARANGSKKSSTKFPLIINTTRQEIAGPHCAANRKSACSSAATLILSQTVDGSMEL